MCVRVYANVCACAYECVLETRSHAAQPTVRVSARCVCAYVCVYVCVRVVACRGGESEDEVVG